MTANRIRRPSHIRQRWPLGALAVLLIVLATASVALAGGAHLGMARARQAVNASVAEGCAEGVCQSWSVSHCERRSSRTVRCRVDAVVRHHKCRVGARAFLPTRRPHKVLVGPIGYSWCADELWVLFSPPEFVVPPGAEAG